MDGCHWDTNYHGVEKVALVMKWGAWSTRTIFHFWFESWKLNQKNPKLILNSEKGCALKEKHDYMCKDQYPLIMPWHVSLWGVVTLMLNPKSTLSLEKNCWSWLVIQKHELSTRVIIHTYSGLLSQLLDLGSGSRWFQPFWPLDLFSNVPRQNSWETLM